MNEAKNTIEYLKARLYGNIGCEFISFSQEDLRIFLNLIEKQEKEIEELKKYDYRKIKLDKKDRITSIHFTQKQLDLMNLGIALYVGIPKILKDENDEETDI